MAAAMPNAFNFCSARSRSCDWVPSVCSLNLFAASCRAAPSSRTSCAGQALTAGPRRFRRPSSARQKGRPAVRLRGERSAGAGFAPALWRGPGSATASAISNTRRYSKPCPPIVGGFDLPPTYDRGVLGVTAIRCLRSSGFPRARLLPHNDRGAVAGYRPQEVCPVPDLELLYYLLAAFGVLAGAGFGMPPIPEELLVIGGGVVTGSELSRYGPWAWLMLPACILVALVADLIRHALGRWPARSSPCTLPRPPGPRRQAGPHPRELRPLRRRHLRHRPARPGCPHRPVPRPPASWACPLCASASPTASAVESCRVKI